MLCPKCNNEIPDNSNCCGYCGEKFYENNLQTVFQDQPVVAKPKSKNTTKIILISIIAVLLVAIIVLCAIFIPDLLDKPDKNTEEETKKVHQVSDEDEEKYELDENGEIVTDENNEPVTKPHNSDNNDEDVTESFEDIYEDIQNGELTTSEVVTMPQGSTVNENKQLLEKAFASGKFYFEMSVENEFNMPVTMTFGTNGTDLYYRMSMNALNIYKMDIGALYKDGKAYAIDNSSKTYCETQSGSTEDMEGIMGSFVVGSESSYIKTSVVNFDGKSYYCEEYATESGTSRYYFDKTTEELKRIEHDNADVGGVIIVEKFVKNPSDSYFSVPSGYKKISEEEFMSKFENLMGGF